MPSSSIRGRAYARWIWAWLRRHPDLKSWREYRDGLKQLWWMQEMERIEQECFPDARPRSEVIVRVEEPKS